uniref:Mucin-13 n=1 Tax=Cyanoderma ruficeps TaxID=181631 RepID=A0A8C3RA56_9PASS
MRRSVLLAVWLGLVLSLLKEASALNETAYEPTETTTSGPTEPAAETSASTTVTTTPTPTEVSALNETHPEPEELSNAEHTEASGLNETDPDPGEMTTSGPTETSVVSETASEATDTPTSGPPENFCLGDPCGRNSATCISLNSSFICECKYGFYYSSKNCYKGKAFPGSIAVRAPYSDSLEIVNSPEYEEIFNNVSDFFSEALKNLSGYMETVIVKMTPERESRSDVSVNVTVTNLFKEDSKVDKDLIKSTVNAAIAENRSYVYAYDEEKPCNVYRCDTKTTDCEEDDDDNPVCKCKPDLERTEWDDRSCSACSKSCSAAANKYCVREEEGITCKCMTNFKKESGKCVACSVGYSGEECSDNTELILIIVGTVLGAIILSLVVAVSVVSVRAKRKQNPEKRSLIKPGYSDINTSEDRPSMFPRVQTTSGHTNPGYQPNNPYEMRSTNRDHFPERDYDDLYEISREPRGFRTQSRY